MVSEIESIMGSIPSTSLLVVAERNGKIDASNKRKLKKICKKGVVRDTPRLRFKSDGAKFCRECLEDHSLTMRSDVISRFVDIVGIDRSYIATEINKLSLVSEKEITERDVVVHCFPSSDEADFLGLYQSIQNGDVKIASLMANRLVKSTDMTPVATVLLKVCKTALRMLPFSNFDKGKSNVQGKIKSDDRSIQNAIFGTVEHKSEKPPTDFACKVAWKVSRRINGSRKLSEAYLSCYSAMVDYRLGRQEIAIDSMNKGIRLLCTGV
jgi:hypothetical protein